MTSEDADLARGVAPWIMISTMPRATMRAILDRDPRRHVLLLAALSGGVWPVGRDLQRGLPLAGSGLDVRFMLLGAAIGIAVLHVNGLIFSIAGRWLGGRASAVEVRAACAWAGVPRILLVAFGFAVRWLLDAATLANGTLGLAWSILVALVQGWTLCLTFVCLAEAHRFSVARAVGTCLLATFAILVPVGFLVGLAAWAVMHLR